MDSSRQLRDGVRKAYSAAAEEPEGGHPFPVGWHFAASLGYPQDLLDELPAAAVDAFSGVSNVAVFADIPPEATVLDLGCGAGLDSLIAARRVGAIGKVIGVDFSDAMLARARRAVNEAELANVEFFNTGAEDLPVEDGVIDVALVNGIFNLNPARAAIFRELARVMRRSGAVYAAELVLRGPLPREVRESTTDWFA